MSCVYCGAPDSFVGHLCNNSPTGKCIIGKGASKCIFCGASSNWVGHPCANSPSGKHALAY